MQRVLTVLLFLCVPLFLFAQHHSEGASSSGGSNSGGSSGFSGGSSGSYSSGSGGSHSSGSYGGSSGGGHTGGGSVSFSSGRSYSTSGVSPTHRGSGIGTNAHSGGEFVSERSHARIAALPAEILAGAAHSSALQAARQELTALPEAKSDLSSVVREPWMQEQIRLHTVSGNAAKDFRQGKFDSELRDYGLEPSKKAYSARLAALGQSPERAALAKRPGWFAKTFMGKSADPERGKPCKGKQCNPPPKPCHGKTCKPSPTPTTAPSAYCWGYLDRCDRHGNCYIRFARTDYSHCGVIYQQLKQEQARAAVLQGDMQSACSADIQCANCAMAVGGFQQSQSRVAQLQRQYKMCVSAAMPMVSRNWTLLPYLLARP